MKYLLMLTLLLGTQIPQKAQASSHPQGCPVSSAEKLVCSVVLCNPIGLAIAESRSECITVNRKFAIYLATLGFWSKPPKCKSRDQNCNKTGRASDAQISTSYCNDLSNTHDKKSCYAAITGQVDKDYCDTFTGSRKADCESRLPPPPLKDCGASYRVNLNKDELGSCLSQCQIDPSSCVKTHTPVNCPAITTSGSIEEIKCNQDCSSWNLCAGNSNPPFNPNNPFNSNFN